MKFHVENEIWSERFAFKLKLGNSVATKIEFVEHDPGSIIEPFMRLTQEDAQMLMDSMYAAGLRPSAAAGSAGQLAATQYHLEDMRKLVLGDKLA